MRLALNRGSSQRKPPDQVRKLASAAEGERACEPLIKPVCVPGAPARVSRNREIEVWAFQRLEPLSPRPCRMLKMRGRVDTTSPRALRVSFKSLLLKKNSLPSEAPRALGRCSHRRFSLRLNNTLSLLFRECAPAKTAACLADHRTLHTPGRTP